MVAFSLFMLGVVFFFLAVLASDLSRDGYSLCSKNYEDQFIIFTLLMIACFGVSVASVWSIWYSGLILGIISLSFLAVSIVNFSAFN